jgi:hypothetical protein
MHPARPLATSAHAGRSRRKVVGGPGRERWGGGGGAEAEPCRGLRALPRALPGAWAESGGLGACVREDLMDLLIERNQLG